jgi:uncharacterized membrane protein YqjE
MIGPDLPALAELRAELARFGGDVQEMLALRWQLASLELRAAVNQLRSLAIALTIAAMMGLTSLPLVAVYLAEVLDGQWGVSRQAWLLFLALGLLSCALLIGLSAYRVFRRRFVGLEESWEELQEDLVWLREWTEQEKEGLRTKENG